MDVYIANLLRENAARTIAIVRDDAGTDGLQDLGGNNEFRDDEEDELDQPPMVPTRKRSNDSLSKLSTVPFAKGDTQKSRDLLLHKFRGLKLRYNRTNKVGVSLYYGSSTLPQNKKNDGEQAYHTVQAATADDTIETKPQNHRWDDIQHSPAPVSQLLLQNVDPAPTLPLRRTSDDNLVLQSISNKKSKCFIELHHFAN